MRELRREVPIRDGTRTRSATRHELLRLLSPAASLPDFSVLDASLYVQETIRHEVWGWHFYGRVKLYIEQTIDASSFFPEHGINGLVDAYNGGILTDSFEGAVQAPTFFQPGTSGIDWRSDGVIAHGPTVLDVIVFQDDKGRIPESLLSANEFKLRLSFGVAGADRAINLAVELSAPTVTEKADSRKLQAIRTN
ncbi:hypothetical protein AB0I98_10915 [Streptomyces sp. NPDC050211]|uniref:hypothetical protein n=1 Tax=Streptomyces sp. NPDC050211 TaxID=3154932 RepID=UPI003423C715